MREYLVSVCGRARSGIGSYITQLIPSVHKHYNSPYFTMTIATRQCLINTCPCAFMTITVGYGLPVYTRICLSLIYMQWQAHAMYN